MTKKNLLCIVGLAALTALFCACSPKLTIREDSAESLFRGANSSYYQGDYKSAEDKYLASLRLKDDADVLGNLSIVYKDTGRFSEAADILKRALKDGPDDYRSLNLALCLYQDGKFDEAVAVADALVLQKDAPEPYIKFYALAVAGCATADAGRYEEAAARLNSALKLKPRSAPIKQKLGDVYFALGDDEKAQTFYLGALALDKTIYNLYLNLSEIAEKKDKHALAYEYLRKFALIEPKNQEVQDKMKSLYDKVAASIKKGDEAKEAARKAAKTLPVIPMDNIDKVPVIRVQLLLNAESIRLKCGSKVKLSVKGAEVGAAEAETEFRADKASGIIVKDSDGKSLITGSTEGATVLTAESTDRKSTFMVYDITINRNSAWAQSMDRSFRGKMEIISTKGGLTLVNVIPLDEYLYSVVPSEISSASGIEALKAQAIVARCYVYNKIGLKAHENADICNDIHCQSYSGVHNEDKNTTAAVDATRGELVFCGGKVISAYFFSNCGGHTRNIEDVWFSDPNKAYKGRADFDIDNENKAFLDWPLTPELLDRWIKSEPRAYCEKDDTYRWFKIIKKPENQIMVVKRDNFGYIREVKVGDKSYVGEKVRTVLPSLRSCLMKFEGTFVYGGGWGHAVGLCQDGAAGMAQKGFKYRDILNHYFTECEVKAIY